MAGTSLPRVPEGLRDLMKAYTKEVLREKPTNLYEFSSDYFERIASARGPNKVLRYEPPQSYEIIMKNRIRQQVPISLVFNVIPDNLTDLIKKFIKAVLREKPENLLIFAVEYFQRLRTAHSPRMEYTKYSAYEKYIDEKGSSFTSQEKCTCGRILSSRARELEAAIEEKPNDSLQKSTESMEISHSAQYLRAVCIIQKQIRKYLKEKGEKSVKIKSASKDLYKSQEYMSAIFIIQRQFRRYLSKKRAGNAIELKEKNRYDSVEYMNAIRIIQRYCRQYLRKTTQKRPLNSNKTPSTEGKLSLTAAAFIIQRAFRNMVKTRRAKRHVNAELDQGDEVNDNASEAASYTSASTALLSTESACEHIEFGGNNYDEAVHQQTIREDEEVDNDNTNNLQSEFITKAIKSKGKSINSNGNDLDNDNLHEEMDNKMKRGLYGQKSRRDIYSEPNLEQSMASKESFEDFPSEVVSKSFNSTENVLQADSKSTLDDQADDMKAIDAEESIKKSVSHLQSTVPVSNSVQQPSEKPSLEKKSSVSDKDVDAHQLKNIEAAILTLDAQVDNKNESNSEKSIKKSISQAENLETAAQSHELDSLSPSESSTLPHEMKNTEESISTAEDLEAATQSGQVDSLTQSKSPSEENVIDIDSNGVDVVTLSNPLAKQQSSSDKTTNEIISLHSSDQAEPSEEVNNYLVDPEHPSSTATSVEDKPTSAEETAAEDQLDSKSKSPDESGKPNSEKDYSIEVNSLQTILNNIKEKNNQDEAILNNKTTTTLSPTEERTLEARTGSTANVESEITTDTNDPKETTEASNSDLREVPSPQIGSANNRTDSEDHKIMKDSPKIESADAKAESEDAEKVINVREDSSSIDIGKSIIIHSVLPGEDDYELTLTPEVTLSSDSISNATENVADISDNIEEKKSVDKINIDEEQLPAESKENQMSLKMDTSDMLVDEPLTNETKKENSTSDIVYIDSTEENCKESSKQMGENLSQQSGEEELGNTNASTENKSMEKQTLEDVELQQPEEGNNSKLNDDTVLESELNDSKAETAEPSDKENKTNNLKESLKNSEIIQSSDSSKDLGSGNTEDTITEITNLQSELENKDISLTELQSNNSELIENMTTSSAENLDDVNNKSLPVSEDVIDKSHSLDTDLLPLEQDKPAEDHNVLAHSESEPKIPVDLEKDEVEIGKAENNDENIKKTSMEVNEDTNVSPIITKQDSIQNDKMGIDKIKTTSAEDTENTRLTSSNEEPIEDQIQATLSSEAEENIEDQIQATLSSEAEEIPHDNVITPPTKGTEERIEDADKTTLSNESQEKSTYDNQTETILENTLALSNDEEIPGETMEKPINASNDSIINDNVKFTLSKEEEEKVDANKSKGNDKELEDEVKTTLSEESQKKIVDSNKLNSTEEVEDKILTSSNADEDNIKTTLSEESQEKTKGTIESAISEETGEKFKDNNETTTSSNGSDEKSSLSNNDVTIKENKSSEISISKSVEEEDANLQVSMDEPQINAEVEPELDKDSVDLEDESLIKAAKIKDDKSANNKNIEAKPDLQMAENKSSLLLNNQLNDTQIKKLPNAKEKQLTSFTSGRLTNAPIAELQLKSFKTDADSGNWYDAYNESTEDVHTDDNKGIVKSAKETGIMQDNAKLERNQSIEMTERMPNYVYGEESTQEATIKPKQSIAYFFSFDGDDGKTSFKIPKRFLRQNAMNSGTSNRHHQRESDQVLSMEPIIAAEEDIMESDMDIGYPQFTIQKLQTIHELNENESSNELKSFMDKSDEDVNEKNISVSEIEFTKKDFSQINAEAVKGVETTDDKVEANEDELKGNETDQTHDFKRKRSAQIIQRAYKNYLTRRVVNTNEDNEQSSVVDNGNNVSEIESNENLAARRIQKAVRQFLAKIAQKTKETASLKDKSYSNVEILAAIRIQNIFRDYIRRKNQANNEDISMGTSATSLITIIPNTNETETPEVSLNDGELSDEMTMLNPEDKATKPEWFVGTQRISLEKSGSIVESSETGTIGITESTDNTQIESDTKLATDIGIIVNELSASKVIAQDNGASNNSAGSTNETLEDLAIAAFGEIDASFTDTSTRQLLNEFLINEIEFSSIQKAYPRMPEEVIEEQCIKRSVSLSNLAEAETKEDTANEKEETQLDAMDEATSKLMKPDEVIEKMSQRRSSETREKLKEDFQLAEPIFGEPIIQSMSSLQEQSSLDIEDGDIIVYNRLQRDETRESSAQSESVVFGNDEEDKLLSNDAETARTQLSRHYTIAGEDPRVIFRSVTIDETVRYIDNENDDDVNGMNNSMSFCLDDETSENIRKKMMAYSLSEGDSDYYDPSKITEDDFHIDTAMTDAMDTSTETESTIVSAATKIQAGARGFLARRRLRRASAGTKSSTQDTKASFGNDAISESLERFIEEEAAKKIQVAYRLHSKKQKKQANNLKSASLESSLAAKRQTLQRGDALRNDSNSTPEDENSSSTSAGQLPKVVETKSGKDNATRSKRNTGLGLKWPTVRQNSMPVQIDCEVLRPLPKHMRRRIKSAENEKKKKRK